MSQRENHPLLCDYCQSPLPGARWGGSPSLEPEPGALYCCLGCRMASSIVQERGEAGAARSVLIRLGLSIFFTMNVMAFTMALWTTDVYEAAEPSNLLLLAMHGLFRYLVLLFSLPVLFLLGMPLFTSAWEGLRRGILSTDALLAAGVGAAFAFSFLSIARGRGSIYFEVGCVILVMTTLGRWLEATGRLKAGSALDALARLLPATVRRIGPDESEETIAIEAVVRGESLRILPGERFPADGEVSRGAALVDEQVLTGESRPVLKEEGAAILGGTLNLDGDLVIKVGAVGAEGTLARLVELVRQARLTKGRYQRLVDRISAWFVPLVVVIALGAFAYHASHAGFEQGLMAGLAVSLIACPCALGLATPLAVWSAIGQAANHQVLFRSGDAIERLASVVAIRFDKTGTLSTGTAAVRELTCDTDEVQHEALAMAAALAGSTAHALSAAIIQEAVDLGVAPAESHGEIRVVPGRGVVGGVVGINTPVSLGSPKLMDELGLLLSARLKCALDEARTEGMSVALVGWSGRVRGLFVFSEQWRAGTPAVLGWLKDSGIDVGILTGDHAGRGIAVSRELGVAVEAELLPDQKVMVIRRVHEDMGPVAMVGDGVNDAPALAASDIGIALGCGTDVSRESAGVCLLGDDLTRIPWSLELARRTIRVVRWNLGWAFAYNLLGVVAAALGWLNPAIAAGLMVVSSVVVIGNSLRLRQPLVLDLTPGLEPPSKISSRVHLKPGFADVPAPVLEPSTR